ncbi:hypothetical protein R3P38DRAFT_3223350 [Favolaschia claudopus]|uniref:Uncharacterized protein n=1 Tax=Favolaschia claudopus TaxID=2862362 RepID=A0AAV9ZX87_9AGAR
MVTGMFGCLWITVQRRHQYNWDLPIRVKPWKMMSPKYSPTPQEHLKARKKHAAVNRVCYSLPPLPNRTFKNCPNASTANLDVNVDAHIALLNYLHDRHPSLSLKLRALMFIISERTTWTDGNDSLPITFTHAFFALTSVPSIRSPSASANVSTLLDLRPLIVECINTVAISSVGHDSK